MMRKRITVDGNVRISKPNNKMDSSRHALGQDSGFTSQRSPVQVRPSLPFRLFVS